MKRKSAYMKHAMRAVFVLLTCVVLPVHALSPVEAFFSMPDELCPYFNRAQKMVLCNQLEAARKENRSDSLYAVPNLFGTESVPLELTDSLLRIQITDGVEYSWWVCADGIVFVQTVCAPVCSSVVGLYDAGWTWLHDLKPDMEALFVSAHVENGKLVYTDETPLLLDEEEKKHYKEQPAD